MSDTVMQIEVENVKCGGCANTIVKGLSAIQGVTSVAVDPATQLVRLDADDALRPAIVERLPAMGYPEKGSVSGLGAAVAGAKSFVSCAVGRLS